MNDPYELIDLIKAVTKRDGIDGFDRWFGHQCEEVREEILDAMVSPAFNLFPHQRMPSTNPAYCAWYAGKHDKHKDDRRPLKPLQTDWRVWLLRMGRGAGKTHAASCAVHYFAEHLYPGYQGIIIGTTVADVRDTQIAGPSGLLRTARPGFEPHFNQHTKTIHWPNGSSAVLRSADQGDEALRGLSVSWAWGDEILKWKSQSVWENLDLCVRELHPNGTRIIGTTTPMGGKEWIKTIEDDEETVVSIGGSLDNQKQDPASLRKRQRLLDKGGRRAMEEVMGMWCEGEQRLWTPELIQDWRKEVDADPLDIAKSMDFRTLSLDPAEGKGGDSTGMVLFGAKYRAGEPKISAILDATTDLSLDSWLVEVVNLTKRYLTASDTILVEVNGFRGIDRLIRMKLSEAGLRTRVVPVDTVKDKWFRAQEAFMHCMEGYVDFYGHFEPLEKELTEWDPDQAKSPDRGDAFAQGVNHLMGTKGRGLRTAFNLFGPTV